MFKSTRLLVIVMGLLTALFLTTTVLFFSEKVKETKQRIITEVKLSHALTEKEKALNELEKITDLKGKLEVRVTELTDQNKELADDARRQKEMKEAIIAELEKAKKDYASTKELLESEKEKNAQLTRKIDKFKETWQQAQESFEQLKKAKAKLEEKLGMVSSGKDVKLEKIVVSPGEKPSKQGQILVVNKEFDFVVVNLGSAEGIAAESVLDVYKNNEIIAKIKAEKIYEHMCAAGIIKDSLKGEISEGDEVRL